MHVQVWETLLEPYPGAAFYVKEKLVFLLVAPCSWEGLINILLPAEAFLLWRLPTTLPSITHYINNLSIIWEEWKKPSQNMPWSSWGICDNLLKSTRYLFPCTVHSKEFLKSKFLKPLDGPFVSLQDFLPRGICDYNCSEKALLLEIIFGRRKLSRTWIEGGMVERAWDRDNKGSCCIQSSHFCTLTKRQRNPWKNKRLKRCWFSWNRVVQCRH